jgi:hypothetical protein
MIALLLISQVAVAQKDTIMQRIVLIGDAGQLTNGKHPVVDAVRQLIKMDAKTTVLYLGDNLYSTGLPDEQYSYYVAAKNVLDTQISLVDNSPAKLYMIPGNHDWLNGGQGGWDAVQREQQYVDLLGKKNVEFFPKDGCPGPVEISLNDDVSIIVYDSQWWLHPYDKPGIESDCPYKTKEEFLTQLDDLLAKDSKKLVILAAHHTFKSSGVHGGYFTLKQHIFPLTDIYPSLYIPLPVIGSIYPIARSVFGTPQDLKHPNYQNMIQSITKVAKKHPNLIFVGGHEHSLQLIKDSSFNYIISGAGCKENRVSKNKRTPIATSLHGFAVMDISVNKTVRITFYTVMDSTKMIYTENILDFSKLPKLVTDTTTRKIEDPFAKYKDTITISASDHYATQSRLKEFIMGKNYRKEWSTPVNMKVLNIKKEKGGLTIVSLGGGKQTKSLTLKDPTGKEWKLRTIDKDPTQAIPENFRNTVANDVAQDFISASHPYAPLVIPTMAKALDLITANPQLFFVPDDPAFGYYRELFANTVCMLEEKDPSRNGEDTKSTYKVFNKLAEDNNHRADQEEVLRARLLDILIGDFDRHFDQWKWATTDTGKGKLYYTIPKDRDQAFFYSDGFLMKRIAGNALPMLKGFRNNYPNVNWLSWPARDYDRLFLTNLGMDDWQKQISILQNTLTDDVIRKAIKGLPKEIYPMDSAVLTQKLISRRNLLSQAGIQYYRFLSRYVNVIGSNKKEYFKVSQKDNGLEVKVYAREKNNDTSFVMYDRVFDPRVTKELRLYGLNDDDIFVIDPNTHSRIKIRIIGGKGNDTFNVQGSVKNFLYDIKNEKNYIIHSSHSRNLLSNEPPVNYYNILGFNYNINRFPRMIFGFNPEDRLFLGVGFWRRTYGFRNVPYASDQKFAAIYAVNKGAYQIKYNGEFNHFWRNNDMILQGIYENPSLNNFFGLGNNSVRNKSLPLSYYRTRYKYVEAEALLRRRYFERLQVMIGPMAYYYWNRVEDNVGRILGKPSLVGLDSASVYGKKLYAGGKLRIYFDNLNNELFPTRGVQWNTEFMSMAGLNKNSHNITKLTSDMSIYASLSDPAKLVAIIRMGGGHIFSRNFEYFQALNLGANNFLRGFRKTRFYGTSIFYNSLEVRFKLFEIKSYLLPGDFGLVGFNDLGRVWLKNESSQRWHDAYGGGIYFVPFKLIIISATVGFSKEERLFNFSLGTKLNLTF